MAAAEGPAVHPVDLTTLFGRYKAPLIAIFCAARIAFPTPKT